MNNNMSIAFTLKYAEYKIAGNDEEQSLLLVGNEFIRRIKGIKIVVSLGEMYSRKYFFHDGSNCTYKGGYWKFNSQIKN